MKIKIFSVVETEEFCDSVIAEITEHIQSNIIIRFLFCFFFSSEGMFIDFESKRDKHQCERERH